jgi:DNA polymerase III sliding clamp (beta) subunit (PCNA family)
MTTLNRKETLAALEITKPALASRASIPELSHIWFKDDYAYAHNGGLGIKTKLSFEPPSCGVPGALFFGLLNQTSTENLEFEVTDDNLSFKSGRSKIKLVTLPPDRMIWRYPDEPTTKPVTTLKVSKAFLAALKHVLILRPSSPKRMEHHAVCIFAVKKEMDLYVTDSQSMVFVPIAEPITGTNKIALPRELAQQIVEQCEAGAVLKMYSDHFMVQATKNTALYSNVFDTTEMLDLPSFAEKFVDTEKDPPFKLPEGLGAALERAVLLAGTEEALVTFTAGAKALKLSGRFKGNQLDEEFTLSRSVAKATISVDAKSFLSVKGVAELAVTARTVNLFGEGDFTYILAAKEGAKTATAEKTSSKRRAPAEEDEEEDA